MSLDENYKGLFEYTENEIIIMGFDEDYVVAVENKLNCMEIVESNYYFAGLKEHSKIKIASSNDEFGYKFEKFNENMSNKDSKNFRLLSHTYSYLGNEQEKSQIRGCRYFNNENTGSGADLLTKDLNYGVFNYGEYNITVFEGDTYLDMIADEISVLYYCKENSPDELARIRIKFTGETTITGKLNVNVDYEFGYQVYFIADSEGIKKFPHNIEDTRDIGGFRFVNEDLEEILGRDSFSKECEIKIKDFNINYSATEVTNTAELVSFRYVEE